MLRQSSRQIITSMDHGILSAPAISFSHRSFKTQMGTQRKTRKQGKSYARSDLAPSRRTKFPAWRERPVEPDKTQKIENVTRRSLEVMRTEVDPRYLSNATSDDFVNYNHSWANFYHRVAQSVPRTLLTSPMYPKLPDSWYTKTFPGYELGKPTDFFDKQYGSKDKVKEWQTGFRTLRSQSKFFDKFTPQLKQFNTRDKPLNPFRYKPHLVNRISIKNPRLLFPFITETGKIKSRVYTGLKTRAQKKVTREIKKMRIMGLMAFGHNPEYGKDHSQPHGSFMGFENYIEIQEAQENHEKRQKQRNLKLTEGKIVWERDFETRRQLTRQYMGLTEEQIEHKKRFIKDLVMENEYLKALGRATPITKLSKVGNVQIDDLLVDNKPVTLLTKSEKTTKKEDKPVVDKESEQPRAEAEA